MASEGSLSDLAERRRTLRGGGDAFLTWCTKKGASPLELSNVFVNHESLVFRGPKIDGRSFVRAIDAAHWRRPSRYAAFLLKNLVRRTVEVPEATWVTNNFSPGSYYHWMTECLPRLLSAGPDTLLLPRSYRRQPYVCFTLQAFPEIRRVGWIGLREKVRVGRLTSLARREADDRELQVVAQRVASLVPGSGPKRVYLSRRKAARRRLLNEREAIDVLERFGFETITIDPSDPAGQVRAVRDAEYVIGVHGADLTNIMFSKAGAKVLELRHPVDEMVNCCYAELAASVGLRYIEHPCHLAPGAAQSGWNVNYSDLVCDVDRLAAELERWTADADL